MAAYSLKGLRAYFEGVSRNTEIVIDNCMQSSYVIGSCSIATSYYLPGSTGREELRQTRHGCGVEACGLCHEPAF